jgi:hypothetical protein
MPEQSVQNRTPSLLTGARCCQQEDGPAVAAGYGLSDNRAVFPPARGFAKHQLLTGRRLGSPTDA